MEGQKGFALVWAYLVIFTLAIMLGGFFGTSNVAIKNSTLTSDEIQAFYLAEAGIDKKITEVTSGNTSNVASTALGGGSYSALYDSSTKTITATGTFNGSSRTLTAVLNGASQSIPPGVKGGVTTFNTMALVGLVTIDGREHDSSGALTGETGTYGMAYGNANSYDGWALPKIGGNGFAPAQNPVPPSAKRLMGSAEAADAATVNSVFGLPSNSTALDAYKSTSAPSVLSNQVYYYTPTSSGNIFNPLVVTLSDLSNSSSYGSGILIVDGFSNGTVVKFKGKFKGLILCNVCYMDERSQVVGAVIPVQPYIGAIKGPITTDNSRKASIDFSTEVLQNLPVVPGSSYGGQAATVKNWIDHKNTAGRLTG